MSCESNGEDCGEWVVRMPVNVGLMLSRAYLLCYQVLCSTSAFIWLIYCGNKEMELPSFVNSVDGPTVPE